MSRLLMFLRMFRRDIMIMLIAAKNPATPKTVKAILLVGALYLISPVDLIPDTMPLLGLVDDMVVLLFIVRTAKELMPGHVLRESEAAAEKGTRWLKMVLIAGSAIVLFWCVLCIGAMYSLIKMIFS